MLNKKELVCEWEKLSCKCALTGIEALEAVKQDGYALRYVKEQTEAVCLEAVKRDGDALRYVKEQIIAVWKDEDQKQEV